MVSISNGLALADSILNGGNGFALQSTKGSRLKSGIAAFVSI
jgi:hypothetical protein